jgi:hypothetical protein
MADSIRSIHREYSDHTIPAAASGSTGEPSSYIQPIDVTRRVLATKTNVNHSDPLVLVNFSPITDKTGFREKLWRSLCTNASKSLTACFDKLEGVQISNLPAIYKRNRRYPFWLSPRGNGLDCHRTWEALYLDIIPIVWHSTLDPLYENLPVVVIRTWDELSEDILRVKLREIATNKLQQPAVYEYEKLRIEYWRAMILRKSRHSPIDTQVRRNVCWRGNSSLSRG